MQHGGPRIKMTRKLAKDLLGNNLKTIMDQYVDLEDVGVDFYEDTNNYQIGATNIKVVYNLKKEEIILKK